ncbi:hypothetical protein ACFYZB_38450 [Streptomyces sp. NPDC001852]|uniref:hypothetical protein n=1 Tax=Streptomyces sp. NPDC001852 TaxID=3364619 RepID=UPI00369F8D86
MSREPEAYTGQTLCSSGGPPLRAFLRTETGGAAVLVAAALAREPLPVLCDELLASLLAERYPDDVACWH